MRSLIGIMTYRRLEALKVTLAGISQHCPQYACVVSEDLGQRDATASFLCAGRSPEPKPDLAATLYTTTDLSTANYPNVQVLLGERNLGVAGNSNRIIKTFLDGDWDHLCLCNDDIAVNGDFVKFYGQAHMDLGIGMFCYSNFTQQSQAISGNVETYKWTSYKWRGYGLKFLTRMTGIMMSITRELAEKIGYFDTEFGKFGEEHPCPAESPVWMGDYTFKPIGDIKVGDTVIGWNRRQAPAKRYGKEKGTEKGKFTCETLQKSTVLAVIRLERPLIEVKFQSGRTLRCAAEHTWLNYHGNKSGNRVYIPAEVGKTLVHVVDPQPVRDETLSYTNGYVHGLISGDGGISHGAVVQRTTNKVILEKLHRSLDKLTIRFTTSEWDYAASKPNNRRFTDPSRVPTITRLKVDVNYVDWKPETNEEWRGWLAGVYDAEGFGRSFGQCPDTHPAIYERIVEGLSLFGFKTKKQKHQIYIVGGWRELVRFWNTCAPTLSYKLDDAVLSGRFKTKDEVVAVTELQGRHAVYCLKTSTGNYVIQGYASKNCDYTIRARLAGGIRCEGQDMHCLDVENNLLGHQDVKTSVTGVARLSANEAASRAMQRAAWEYRHRHYHRPFRLESPATAGGYYGEGIPCRQLEQIGYKSATSV